jgi:hypothetical protein
MPQIATSPDTGRDVTLVPSRRDELVMALRERIYFLEAQVNDAREALGDPDAKSDLERHERATEALWRTDAQS